MERGGIYFPPLFFYSFSQQVTRYPGDLFLSLPGGSGQPQGLDTMYIPVCYNIDTSIEANTSSTYILAGVNYHPGKGLIITPNVRQTIPEEGEGITHAMLNFQFQF